MAACSSTARKPSNTALFENGHHPETIIELSREIELDTGSKPPFPAAGTPRVA